MPDITVIRRADSLEPIDNRRLRRAVEAGAWVPVAPGAYADGAGWRALDSIERHRLRVVESGRRLQRGTVVSHFAAAAVWGIDMPGAWPRSVDVRVARATGGRSSGVVRRHAIGDECASVAWDRLRLTTPAQTAIDIARVSTFLTGVAVMDQALWERRPGGALATRTEMELLIARTPQRGDGKVHRALAASATLSDNVRETQSRLVIARLGFPAPRLQERRVLRTGRVVFADLYFPDHDHWCEIDGRAKYRDPRFLGGRTPEQAVIDEKNRENEIRREVRAFSRWEAADADHPRRLYDLLTLAGLPASRPRP
jgi:hypothetical protein